MGLVSLLTMFCGLVNVAAAADHGYGPVVAKGPQVLNRNIVGYTRNIDAQGFDLHLDEKSQISAYERGRFYLLVANQSLEDSSILVGVYSKVELEGPFSLRSSRIGALQGEDKDLAPAYTDFVSSANGAIEMKDSSVIFALSQTKMKQVYSGGYVELDAPLRMSGAELVVGVQAFVHLGCNYQAEGGHVRLARSSALELEDCGNFYVGPIKPNSPPAQLDLGEHSNLHVDGPVSVYLSDALKIEEHSELHFHSDGKAFTCYTHEPVVIKGHVVINSFDSKAIPAGMKCHQNGDPKAKELAKLLL